MKEFFRNILIKITGIGWCDTPRIQMEQEAEIEARKQLEINSRINSSEINKK